MAQRRMISKTISTSKKVNRLSDTAALIYTWLIPHTDDFGRMDGDWVSIKAIVVPMRPYTDKQVAAALKEMEEAELIRRYTIGKDEFLEIVNFEHHQTFKNDRPRTQMFPAPSGVGTDWKPQDSTRKPDGNIVQLSEVKIREENISNTHVRAQKAFDVFWKTYPRKVAKPVASRAWIKGKFDEDTVKSIITAVERFKSTRAWKESNGRFIPHPATFLNQRRWEDDVTETPKLKADKF